MKPGPQPPEVSFCIVCGAAVAKAGNGRIRFCRECKLPKGKHTKILHFISKLKLSDEIALDYYYFMKVMPTACEFCGSTDRLHLDHDHNTLRPRGILCHKHNILLGQLRDSSEGVWALLCYVMGAEHGGSKRPNVDLYERTIWQHRMLWNAVDPAGCLTAWENIRHSKKL